MISSKSQNTLKTILKTEAFNLGFSHIGFTEPVTPDNYAVFLNWIDLGYAADMNYLKREDTISKRAEPLKILPSCKSIIILALPYNPPSKDNSRDKFKISSYAQSTDYHLVIPSLLEKLITAIKNHTDQSLQYRIYTDTGPIMEKAFAQMAGIGWIGKHSCLISPGFGSYFFLSTILINIEFEPDPPFPKELCGSCTRCIDNCPTGCILPNRTINASKCISYLTIENHSNISEDLRKKVGKWIFGCDVCQQVCPWNNRFASNPKHDYFNLSAYHHHPFNLLEELKLTDLEFKQKFSQSPILRANNFGYKRNLLVAASNSFSDEVQAAVDYLLANETDPILLDLAQWALRSHSSSD